MSSTCDVYKGSRKLGSGSCSAGSFTLTGYGARNDGLANDKNHVVALRSVKIVITQAGTHVGRSWNTRVLVENPTTCTLRDACPFVGA